MESVRAGNNAADSLSSTHNAGLNLAFPDDISRFHGFHSELSRLGGSGLTNPYHFVFGAPVLSLHPDHLPHFGDSRHGIEAGSDQRDFISTATVPVRGPYIRKDLYRNGDMQPLLLAGINSGRRFCGRT